MKSALEQIVEYIVTKNPSTKAEFERAKQKISGKLKIIQPSNRSLLKAYQNLIKKKRLEKNINFEKLTRKADIRSLSGIAIITSLAKPHACPGKCVYCPNEKSMPKSYLATEPAAARALGLKFNPYEQMIQRVKMLESNGHNTDKIEFIIKGGTWNAYSLKYQYWFILESFKACNNLKRKNPIEQTKEKHWKNPEQLQKELKKEQKYNENANHRIIGLTLETRPDAISPKTIYHMRKQGCTRIELGLQATDDRILKLVKRGHTVEQFKKAMLLLRHAGFKVDLHFMPDLPGSNPKHDVEMYKIIFNDPGLKPDMVKIYPCTVIKTAELYKWLKNKKYRPYCGKKLFNALLEMKMLTPLWCRISRLVRDIPANEIQAGNMITNLRENLVKELKRQNKKCACLRCREIGRQKENLTPKSKPMLFIEKYETVGGTEYFLNFEDKNRIAVFGFLRLRIPEKNESNSELLKYLPEIKDCAFIREIHVYDQMVGIGEKDELAAQHKGLGKKLVKLAEKISQKNNFKKIAVISGVGVRGYYKKLGYRKKGEYMIKNI